MSKVYNRWVKATTAHNKAVRLRTKQVFGLYRVMFKIDACDTDKSIVGYTAGIDTYATSINDAEMRVFESQGRQGTLILPISAKLTKVLKFKRVA